MPDVALISELTWRSLEMQKAAFPDMPHFVGPDEIAVMMRPSNRRETLNVHVLSLGVIAEKEKQFVDFLKLLKARMAALHSKEEEIIFFDCRSSKHFEAMVKRWKVARKFGAAKVGGRISAEKREGESRAAIAKIEDRWPLPNKTWPTKVLLKEADLSYNTAVKFLGKRPIAQYNYQAKIKRAANKVKK